jgi:IS5 family transposase
LRASRTCQLPRTFALGEHEHLSELREISRILDARPEVAEIAHTALTKGRRDDRGREALSAEQVVRATALYKMHGWNYRELEFELRYNEAYRSFCRLRWDQSPSKSALNRDIKSIDDACWTAINHLLVEHAIELDIEDGTTTRTDCTVTEAHIHHPTDSSLLYDCVRKLTDLMDKARKKQVVNVSYRNHRKVAKRRDLAIINAKRQVKRIPLYRDLLKYAVRSLGYARRMLAALRMRKHPLASALAETFAHFIGLTEKVIDQTERRVLHGESVSAEEKIVSIFEEHTDVIRKGGRETHYGHKICLSVGRSNLITDCVVLDGNPADSTLTVSMMERHAEIFGSVPEQVAFDGAFASQNNLAALKSLGVDEVMFHAKSGIAVEEMVSCPSIYKKLRNFRAGVEGVISYLKRVFGADRCRWKGARSFTASVLSSVVAANLLTLARHALS